LDPQVTRLDTGDLRVGSGRLRQPPLPALGARFTGLQDLGQGKGSTRILLLPRAAR